MNSAGGRTRGSLFMQFPLYVHFSREREEREARYLIAWPPSAVVPAAIITAGCIGRRLRKTFFFMIHCCLKCHKTRDEYNMTVLSNGYENVERKNVEGKNVEKEISKNKYRRKK